MRLPTGVEEAASAVQRALLHRAGPAAAEQLALAQVRLAWQEVVTAAGLARGSFRSRVVGVRAGAAAVEASDPILAQEIRLRADALTWALNERMRGRPGAIIHISALIVAVGRSASERFP
jgi:hypothetical protein